jgi:hypothetical protein
MADTPKNAAGSLSAQNGLTLTLTSAINRIVYSLLHFFKSSQFRAKAWCNSWIILRAFDSRLYKKRIVIFCSTMCVIAVSLIIILTAV